MVNINASTILIGGAILFVVTAITANRDKIKTALDPTDGDNLVNKNFATKLGEGDQQAGQEKINSFFFPIFASIDLLFSGDPNRRKFAKSVLTGNEPEPLKQTAKPAIDEKFRFYDQGTF